MSALKRNIESRHTLTAGDQVVDIRPFSDKFTEWVSVPMNFLALVLPTAVFTVVLPILGLLTFPFLLITTLIYLTSKSVLPIRYPVDGVDPKGKKGQGILYIGSIASDSPYENFKEIWLSDDDLRKHMLILGSTGSGKSEALKSIFYNALNWSSGFFIADGKADNKLPTDVYTMVRSNGRDPDLLYLNFLLAGKTPEQVRRSRRRRTNKLNPFSSADADTIIQMGSNLLPKVEGEGKNWQEKALNLWRSAVAALCYKRDTAGFELSIATFIDYMSLPKIEELYLEGYQEALSRGGDWSYGFAGIKNYLESGCPAYQTAKLLKKHGFVDDAQEAKPAFGGNRAKSGKEFEQDTMAYEQHSYRTNQLMPVLNLLDKTYGFIFRDKYPEIDMNDVTLRNRILVMLIPSLEKSAAEAENLGKLAIACLRVMMSKNLGAELEGDYEELLGSKATNSPYPYIVALDELAYYFSDGIAVMFAQARSLGTCMIAAAQDLEKLTEGSRASEAGAMLANQVTKFFMRIDDTGKTAEMIQKVVGKATVAVKRSFRIGSLGYSKKGDVDVVELDRVSTSKLQSFGQGEGIVNALGQTSFMRWFYMGKDIEVHRVKKFWVNRFLQVASPTKEEIIANSIAIDELNDPYRRGQELLKKLNQETPVEIHPGFDPVLSAIGEYAQTLSEHDPAVERAIKLYLAAEKAILDEEAVIAGGGSSRRGDAHKQSPRNANGTDGFIDAPGTGVAQDDDEGEEDVSPTISPVLDQDGEETTDHDVLAFLNEATPFERKPSAEVLGINLPGNASTLEQAAASLTADPFKTMLERSQTLNFSDDLVLRGKILSQIIGAPKVVDAATGLPVDSHDDWIGNALAESERMIDERRSSDDTVIGLNQPTMVNVEAVETLLKSPSPESAAKSLEKVIASKVTPNTIAEQPIDMQETDVFFGLLEERLHKS